MRGIRRILGDFVEVNDAIEGAAGADPVVDRFAHLLAFFGPVPCSAVRCERGADGLDAVLVRGVDYLLETPLELFG